MPNLQPRYFWQNEESKKVLSDPLDQLGLLGLGSLPLEFDQLVDQGTTVPGHFISPQVPLGVGHLRFGHRSGTQAFIWRINTQIV